MMVLMQVAAGGGALLLEGATGVGKTSLALECAHRLPRAHWLSAWPSLDYPGLVARLGCAGQDALEWLELQPTCLFVDHLECLQGGTELLALASHRLTGSALIGISDRRLTLPQGSRVVRLRQNGPPAPAELPEECQLLSLSRYGLPRACLSESCLNWLHERFLSREEEGWVSLHPQLVAFGTADQYLRAAEALEQAPASPRVISERFHHLWRAGRYEAANSLFVSGQAGVNQSGDFAAVVSMAELLLQRDPRQATAYCALAEAHAGQGKLELALADYTHALNWGDEAMQVRALAARCHLWLDLGRLEEASLDAEAAMTLAERLGGRQPGRVKACHAQARVCNLRGQSVESESWARRGLELAVSLCDSKGEAYAYFILGQALAEQQRWEESLQHSLSALRFARQQGERRLTLLARYWAGAALLHLQRLEWAEELLGEAWTESRQFGDLKMQILGDLMRAQCLLAQGQPERARQHLAEAEKLVRRGGFPVLAVRSLLLKQALEGDAEAGRAAQLLADSVGLALEVGPTREVWTQGQQRALPLTAVDSLRERRHDYDLFIDLEQGQVHERQLGPVALLGKRIPTALLLALMRQPGQVHSAENLYAVGWGHEFEGESSAAQVRKNIAALRTLIEPQRQQPRYLLAREQSFGVSGGYYFSEMVAYCVICRQPLDSTEQR